MKLNISTFGLASGIFWGSSVFILTWWLIVRGLLLNEPTFIGYIYPYYTVSPLGSVIGLFYGFVDGLFAGLIFAWLYNLLTEKEKRSEV